MAKERGKLKKPLKDEAPPLIVNVASNLRVTCPYLVQGSAKSWPPGLVNVAAGISYYFCLALPAAFTQPGAVHLAGPC